jgi:hypothetical protein
MNNLQKKQKYCHLAEPQKLCRKIFCFAGKICFYEISLYVQKTKFFSGFDEGRIKPWTPVVFFI